MQNPPDYQFPNSENPAHQTSPNQIPPQTYAQSTGPYGGYGGPPPRSGRGCGTLFGLGCGGCALVLVGLVVLAIIASVEVGTRSKAKSNGGAAMVPAQYTGDWQGQDGTKISIRGDGTGNFDMGHKSVTGGTAVINETAMTLTITGLFNLSNSWHIDQTPQSVNGTDEMKLSGMVFRRTGGFDPGSSKTSSGKSNTGFSVHYGSSSSQPP